VCHLRGRATPPSAEVAAALLGLLGAVCSAATFVRGFPEVVTIWTRQSAIRPAIGLPGWALVRSITIDSGWRWEPAAARAAVELLTHPVMKRLDTLEGVPDHVLPDLVAMPSAGRIDTLSVGVTHSAPEHLVHLGAFTALRYLTLHTWHEAPWAAPISPIAGASLDVLEVQGWNLRWLECVAPLGARVVRLHSNTGWTLDVERTLDGTSHGLLDVARDNASFGALDSFPSRALDALVVRNRTRRDLEVDLRWWLARFAGRLRFEP
jgi:hypothetical protein